MESLEVHNSIQTINFLNANTFCVGGTNNRKFKSTSHISTHVITDTCLSLWHCLWPYNTRKIQKWWEGHLGHLEMKDWRNQIVRGKRERVDDPYLMPDFITIIINIQLWQESIMGYYDFHVLLTQLNLWQGSETVFCIVLCFREIRFCLNHNECTPSITLYLLQKQMFAD